MSLISSNTPAIIEQSRNIPKVSRLYNSIEFSGRNLQSRFPKPPKNSPVSIHKFYEINRKISLSSKPRKVSFSENKTQDQDDFTIKVSSLEGKTIDHYMKNSTRCRKHSRVSTDFSSNNSTFNSNQSFNSPNSNSPKESNSVSNSKKRSCRAGIPARFLSVNEPKRNKPKNLPSFGQKDQEMLRSIVESDKLNFKLELVYRENRKHKLVQKFAKLEDTWEWSSYGSVSPDRKVRFAE